MTFSDREKTSPTYLLSEVPRSSNNHSVGFEVLHVYISRSTHQQLMRLQVNRHDYLMIICKDRSDFVPKQYTPTSNSFSSNMANRFSGTSSFKPAVN